MSSSKTFWTNPSVQRFAGEADPVQAITDRARQVVYSAIEAGWSGPPFDPFALADQLGIQVVPRDDLPDARTVPVGTRGVRIEFNPNRPAGRLRYSMAHEIAHTLFEDCYEAVRNRDRSAHGGDTWQLELLCNIAASEIVMPIGLADDLAARSLSVDHLMQLRKHYDVSIEAIFIRAARLTREPCAIFAASRVTDSPGSGLRIDYSISSRSWKGKIRSGFEVTSDSILSECTAVGYTAKSYEKWGHGLPNASIECVGIPPYPNTIFPRIMGVFLSNSTSHIFQSDIRTLRGDATEPRGPGLRIIAHIVNDKTSRWGAGFARAIRNKFPVVQQEFQQWVDQDPSRLRLGNTHFVRLTESLGLFQMVAQHGYGPSSRPRIRYAALRECLEGLANLARANGGTIHMPRIGTGQAGGNWQVVADLIDEILLSTGVGVTVYDLPWAEEPVAEQLLLGFRA
jgi:O-acetyl-ADP-ribose deacetylase (regulator of RNase III)